MVKSNKLPGFMFLIILSVSILMTLACGRSPAGTGVTALETKEVMEVTTKAPGSTNSPLSAVLATPTKATQPPIQPSLTPVLTSIPYLPTSLAVINPDNAGRLEPLAALSETGVGVIAFSPDSMRMAAGLFNTNLTKVWELSTGEELLSLDGHVDSRIISYLAFSPDSARLASGAQSWDAVNDSLILWDAASGSELQRFDGVLGAVSPDWQIVALTQREQKETTLVLSELVGGDELHTLEAAGDIYGVSFSPDGERVAAKMFDPIRDLFAFWSVRSGRLDLTLYDWSGFSYSPDGRFIAALVTSARGADKGELNIFDGVTFKYIRTLRGEYDSLWYTFPAFSPDGKVLVASSADHVTFWETQSWKELTSLTTSDKAGVIFSPDGHILVTSTFSGPVQLWGVEGE